ncbi:MAG TPA: hypothetical protein VJH33_00350 [Candidatus Paceibacterota bacterium]
MNTSMIAQVVALTIAASVGFSSPTFAFEPYPSGDVIRAMEKNMREFGKIIETHPPTVSLSVLTPLRGESGDEKVFAVHFYSFGDGGRWMVEERVARKNTYGIHITSWEFWENDRIVTIKKRMTGLQNEREPPTKRINQHSPLWKEAMEKSRMAWKLLCATYPCPALQ